MTKHEFDFISYLFNDETVTALFKDNTITFCANDENDTSLLVIVYPGSMKKFLTILAALDIPDYSALCNIPTAAAAALHFIK